MSVTDGLVIYALDGGGPRLVVPERLHHQVAKNLHASHQGVEGMLQRARQAVYWPGMEGDLDYYRKECTDCNLHVPSQGREPLILTSPAISFSAQSLIYTVRRARCFWLTLVV